MKKTACIIKYTLSLNLYDVARDWAIEGHLDAINLKPTFRKILDDIKNQERKLERS